MPGFPTGELQAEGQVHQWRSPMWSHYERRQGLRRIWAWGSRVPGQHQRVKGPRRGGNSLFRGRFPTYAATLPTCSRHHERAGGTGQQGAVVVWMEGHAY